MKETKPMFLALVALMAAGCASLPPTADMSAVRARTALNQLTSNPQLVSRAPVAIAEAEQAVRAAEHPAAQEEAQHLGYLAERRVEIAQHQAQQRQAEEQLVILAQQRDRMQVAHMAQNRQAEFAQLSAGPPTAASQRAFLLPQSRSTPAPVSTTARGSGRPTRGYCMRGTKGGLYCTSAD